MLTERLFQSTTIDTRFLRERFGFGARFLQDLGGHFFQSYAEFEHGCFGASSPAGDFPVGTDEFDTRIRAKVEEQRELSTIKLLAKGSERLRFPRGPVG